MTYRLSEIAASLGTTVLGDASLAVTGLAEPASAGPEDLALATNAKYADGLKAGQARAAVLWDGADWQALGLDAAIIPARPRFMMAGLTAAMDPGQGLANGIHPAALIDPEAELGEGVHVGPFTVIAPGAQIGAGSVIGPQCYIGRDVVLGPEAFLREQVTIGARARIGARFIAQPGVRLAGDGFSFVTEEKSAVETTRETLGNAGEAQAQSWNRIHSLGSIEIGDDVEIGANSCVDSGTIRATRVGSGCKIDNFVHIGHNVEIGRDCLLCGHVGVAGSSVVGNNVVLGGQVGVSDNITLGDNVIAGGASAIMSNVPAGRAVLGYPATKMDSQIETYKSLRRLPRLLRDVSALKKAVFKDGSSD